MDDHNFPAAPAWARAAWADGRAHAPAYEAREDWQCFQTRDSDLATWALPVELLPGEGEPDDVLGVVLWHPIRGVGIESETRGEVAESLRSLGMELGNRATQLTVADRALWRAVGDMRAVLLTGPNPTAFTVTHSREMFRDAQNDARIYAALRPHEEERLLLLLRARVLGDAWLRRVAP